VRVIHGRSQAHSCSIQDDTPADVGAIACEPETVYLSFATLDVTTLLPGREHHVLAGFAHVEGHCSRVGLQTQCVPAARVAMAAADLDIHGRGRRTVNEEAIDRNRDVVKIRVGSPLEPGAISARSLSILLGYLVMTIDIAPAIKGRIW